MMLFLFRTTADIVQSLSDNVDDGCQFDMVIRRSHVLSDALRRMNKASFDPRKRINVRF